MLFTKKQIQKLINEEKDFIYLQTYIGFEDIGQGYGYKSVEAWDSDDSDVIVYIPEYCYKEYEDTEGTRKLMLEIDSCYTKQDFLDITNNNLEQAEDLFESVDWQHPTTLWNEWDSDEEIKEIRNDISNKISVDKKQLYSLIEYVSNILNFIDTEEFEDEDNKSLVNDGYNDFVLPIIEILKEEK